ncbi:hypothetical protein, partial [Streptomyces sp. NPDC058086]|uniref:hypothetical protein n=1 Tax=Streptomyces sp. NPDC058086 TaxID=3346334 RepID=UPI0036E2CFC3
MRFHRIAAGVIAAAASFTVLTAPPAIAAGTAYHTGTSYIPYDPGDVGGSLCIASRSIKLAAGTYSWGSLPNRYDPTVRSIYLDAGTYTWVDCLAFQTDGYWHVISKLKPPAGSS